MPTGAHPDAVMRYIVPLLVVVVVVVLRNLRPRRVKIERLWIGPCLYLVLMAMALAGAPPPLTPATVILLVVGFLLGAAAGWQRGRFIRLHIDPATHDITSRASVFGIVFILAIFALRYAGRDLLAGNAALLHIPLVAVGDAFLVLALTMVSTQRLEVWQRATRMLAEAKAGSGPRPPQT